MGLIDCQLPLKLLPIYSTISSGPEFILHSAPVESRASWIERTCLSGIERCPTFITASDMRADPFERIVEELERADYVDTIVVALGVAPDEADYRETCDKVASLGKRCHVLWTDGPKVQSCIPS